MKISILTLFPEMFQGPFDYSILKRAKNKGQISIEIINIRDFGLGRHKIVDDRPFGGGTGMILRVDVIAKALEFVKLNNRQYKRVKTILLDARGNTYNQARAKKFSDLDHLILVAGHYEGMDERINKYLVDESISVGNYILTGGEIPTMVIVDSVVRLISGVLSKTDATKLESFSKPYYLEHPQYTKPRQFRDWTVPGVLVSGNHKEIEEWKKRTSKKSQ